MQLILTCISVEEDPYFICSNIADILSAIEIYHLIIYGEIFAGTLVEILFEFNQLDSVKILSLSLSQPRSLSDFERTSMSHLSSTNRITKVNLGTIDDLEEVYFLIELCPHMVYLRVDDLNKMNVQLFVRFILMKLMVKPSHRLQLFSFRVRAADDQTIQQLNQIIDDKKLLFNYTITRVLDFIDLQWN
jgi:hypothetical protein